MSLKRRITEMYEQAQRRNRSAWQVLWRDMQAPLTSEELKDFRARLSADREGAGEIFQRAETAIADRFPIDSRAWDEWLLEVDDIVNASNNKLKSPKDLPAPPEEPEGLFGHARKVRAETKERATRIGAASILGLLSTARAVRNHAGTQRMETP